MTGRFAHKLYLGLLLGLVGWQACAAAPATYAEQAPLSEYMMDRDAEIAMAKSAAPGFVSDKASIYVLTSHGYELAVKGSNGFACFVDRAWSKPFQDPAFWDPKMRGPTCLDPPARSVLAITEKITEWALARQPRAQIEAETKAAVERNEFPPIEPGAMSYMMSKDQWLPSRWHPHVMFYFPASDPDTWGDVKANNVLVIASMPENFVVVMSPVRQWSDGEPDTPAPTSSAPHSH